MALSATPSPDYVSFVRLYARPVLEGSAAVSRPGHLIHALRAFDALDPESLPELSRSNVSDELLGCFTKCLSLFQGQTFVVAEEAIGEAVRRHS